MMVECYYLYNIKNILNINTLYILSYIIFLQNMSLAEAETLALSILKQVMEEDLTSSNVDIACVAPEFHLYSAEEVEAVIARL